MKKLLVLLFIITSVNVYTQSQVIEGTYQLESRGNSANIQRTLILNTDGTFLFHAYEKHENGIPPEKNSYAKGTWTSERKVLYFFNSLSDLDMKHTLSFNNSKARFISKSPRDKSDRIIKTSLRFYESDIFWIKGMRLVKK